MIVALVGAFGYFFKKAARLYKIMMAVDGEAPNRLDRINARVKVLFVDVLG